MGRKRNGEHKHGRAVRDVGRLWHPEVPGPLWNGTQRVAEGQIEAHCRVLAREVHPDKVILFGSYATGRATADSDVDLLVVMPFRDCSTDMAVEICGRELVSTTAFTLPLIPQGIHLCLDFLQAHRLARLAPDILKHLAVMSSGGLVRTADLGSLLTLPGLPSPRKPVRMISCSSYDLAIKRPGNGLWVIWPSAFQARVGRRVK